LPADTIATDPVPNASPAEAPRGLTRSEFLSQLALGIAAIPFGVTVYGVASGRHNFQVLTRKVPIRGLPDAFDGLRVLQVSDLHLGSFGGEKMLRQAVRLINDQAPDVILHTGDMVNDVADEMKPYLHVLRELRAPLGKFAVLGNHDYGGYVRWGAPEQQVANFDQLLRQFDQAEFKLLRNEHFLVQKNGQTLPIVGVENWGLPPFPQLGDLDLATQGLPADAPKILLSHDPSHWDAHALVHPQHFSLTLAGHTHGMQLGVELGDWRWSPVEMKYPRWADLYTEGDQHLYVNRGLGCLGYPGRVGILPEITVLVLEKA
jgi:predicted MPP superfamily phosphohydrolase